jgi:hypothetical protein
MTRPPILGMQFDRRKVLDIVYKAKVKIKVKSPHNTPRISTIGIRHPLKLAFGHNVSRELTSVEEHVSHGSRLPVHLERVSGEDDPLGDDPGRVGAHKGSHGDQVRA